MILNTVLDCVCPCRASLSEGAGRHFVGHVTHGGGVDECTARKDSPLHGTSLRLPLHFPVSFHDSPRCELVDDLHVLHDVLEGPALFDVQAITCLLVGVPVIYHDTGEVSGDIAALHLWS